MKLLQIGESHPRNSEFIIRACSQFGIEYHCVRHVEQLHSDIAFDIVWCPTVWVNPDRFPTSKILFGPQFWVFPDPTHLFFTDSKPEHGSRCIYLCLSEWIVTKYQEFADIAHSNIPFVPIPFGVDIPNLRESISSITHDCILYTKYRDPAIIQYCESLLVSKNIKYLRFHYGTYTLQDYLDALKCVKFVVWVGCSESQGFAVQECLARGIPIYMYDVQTMKDVYIDRFIYASHKENLIATTAPYWSEQCGIKVNSNTEFDARLDEFITKLPTFDPASYIKETLSDEVCFKRFMAALHMP
jgi:hypothetical protein